MVMLACWVFQPGSGTPAFRAAGFAEMDQVVEDLTVRNRPQAMPVFGQADVQV